jgi:hypothetical protein
MKIRFKNGLIIATTALLTLGVLFSINVKADQLSQRYVKMSNNTTSATGVIYEVGFNRPNNGIVGSIMIEVCSNDPFIDEPCTIPLGFSFSGSSIISQSGINGLSVDSASTANRLLLTRTANNVNAGSVVITLNNVTNPNISESYFVRLATYATTDGSGPAVDYGGIAIAFTDQTFLSTEVPPYLALCVAVTIPGFNCFGASGDYIDFGELSKTTANARTSQFAMATNAGVGVTVTILGTTMTSGNDVINPIAGLAGSAPGTSQFGINLTANSNPSAGQIPAGPGVAAPTVNYSQINRFRFVSGDTLVNNSGTTDYKKFTVTYLVNVSNNQPPGVYSSTFIYSALALF